MTKRLESLELEVKRLRRLTTATASLARATEMQMDSCLNVYRAQLKEMRRGSGHMLRHVKGILLDASDT